MGIIDLYTNYGIETAPEGHKHCIDGWINISCPHNCTGSEGFHLGFNLFGCYYSCWRCGGHSIPYTLSKLLQVRQEQAKQIAYDYNVFRKNGSTSASGKVKIGLRRFKYPSGVDLMTTPHRRYLEKRNFDPDQLSKEWGILGTSPTSILKGVNKKIISYRYRILIPISWDGQVVTFQCRDYTDKQDLKYMACPQEREIKHHKHLLYGNSELWKKRVGIVVEGVTDVWRLRGCAGGTLGTGYTKQQLRLLVQLFDKLFILFDPEAQAQKEAEKLKEELMFRGVDVYNYTDLKTDPGAMSDDDAEHLLKELKLI